MIIRGNAVRVGKGKRGVNNSGWKAESIILAERVYGSLLPAGVEVHHLNGDVTDNALSNLVICQDRAYHKLLHNRLRAFENCGNANYRKCKICKNWDDPKNLYIKENKKNGPTIKHRLCHATYEHQRKQGG